MFTESFIPECFGANVGIMNLGFSWILIIRLDYLLEN